MPIRYGRSSAAMRTADFNNSADAIDTSDKNSNGYGDSEPA